jgi:phospho-N-acetylmuramoyl-pentapeptide-transferase
VFYYLYLLSQTGATWLHPFNVFQYVTFRAAGAAFCAFVIALLIGPRIIRRLREMKITDRPVKNDSRQLDEMHKGKASTPTMGGLLIVGGTVLSILLWAAWPGAFYQTKERPEAPAAAAAAVAAPAPAAAAGQPRSLAERYGGYYVLLGLAVLLATAALGFVDDRFKLLGVKGLRLWTKLAWQVLIGLAAALAIYHLIDGPEAGRVSIPFFRYDKTYIHLGELLPWGAAFVVFAALVLVGSSNAVNLTDGLDGLAGGCAALVAVTYAALAYVASNARWCEYLRVPFVQGSGELAVCAAALGGACLGFLWFNSHPAEVFMGDTGSLPIGAFIGYTALAVKHEFLLVLVGGVFVAEAVSVLLQIASFRMFGRRIFKCAPLHHHFEFLGWPENKVVVRFWIAGIVLALASIATLKIR